MNEPWYADGLAFTCTRCGKCCTGAPGYVWVDDKEIATLAKGCGQSIESFTAMHVRRVGSRRSLKERPGGECVFYKAGVGCTVYEHRPVQCQTWPFWSSNIESPDAWERTRGACPGSGQGELFTADQIVELSRKVRL